MKHTLSMKFLGVLFISLISFSSYAQEKAKIKIRKEVNGNVEQVEREVEITSGADLEQILQDLDILDEFGNLTEGQAFEITVKKYDLANELQEYDLSYFPAPASESKAFLGVRVNDSANDSNEANGAYISEIIQGTPAGNSPLQAGDIIVELDKEPVTDYVTLVSSILSHQPGDVVKIKYIRDGEVEKTKVTLGEKEAENERFLWNFSSSIEPPVLPGMFDTEGEELFFEARPFLGVTPVSHMEKGVKLGSIIDGSAAQKAGLQAGDVVLKISGSEVNSFEELTTVIKSTSVGQELEIVIDRDDKEQTIQATMGQRQGCSMNGGDLFQHYQGMDEDGEHELQFELNSAEMTEDLATMFEDLSQMGSDLSELAPTLENLEENLAAMGEEIDLAFFEELEELQRAGYELSSEVNVTIELDDISEEEAAAINEAAEEKLRLENDLDMQKIAFFPNPNRGQFVLSFELPADEEVQISIYNSKGENVYSEQLNNFSGAYRNTIDLSNLANGAYYMQILQGDQTYSKKLIKGS